MQNQANADDDFQSADEDDDDTKEAPISESSQRDTNAPDNDAGITTPAPIPPTTDIAGNSAHETSSIVPEGDDERLVPKDDILVTLAVNAPATDVAIELVHSHGSHMASAESTESIGSNVGEEAGSFDDGNVDEFYEVDDEVGL